jgi:hypothetical protein
VNLLKNLNKVKAWVQHIKTKKHPQTAHASITKSLQHEWTFTQKVLNEEKELFNPLRCAIRSSYFPVIFGSEISNTEADLFHLPTRLGGMGLSDPVENAPNLLFLQ